MISFVLVAVATARNSLIAAPSASAMTRCLGKASYPCLPGMDAVGIGYDAVRGTSFGVGRPVVKLTYSEGDAKVWNDPFGNETTYSYANEATVTQSTKQLAEFSVFRSVTQFISHQQMSAHADAEFGMFFKASVDTQWAATTMKDGLHVVAVSSSELGVYSITLKPPMFLQPDSNFAAYIDGLPSEYDAYAYAQFIKYYGTHYVAAGTLGGRANMRTVISHDYYSTQSDSSISAQARVTWSLFGGGGGGGSSINTTDQRWRESSVSSTHTEGGDPAIQSFKNDAQWTAWAKSVRSMAPVVTSVALEPLWSLVADKQKQMNLMTAIRTYASNASFPLAELEGYRMDWCDCYADSKQESDPSLRDSTAHGCSIDSWKEPGGRCQQEGCFRPGFFMVERAHLYQPNPFVTSSNWCCRPCFTAQN